MKVARRTKFKVGVHRLEERREGRLELVGNSETDDDARKKVRAGMERLIATGRTRIVVDCAALDWMTVDVVGAIVGDFVRLTQVGGGIAFAALPKDPEELLRDLGVLEFATAHRTIAAAAKATRTQGNPEGAGPPSEHRLSGQVSAGPGGVQGIFLVGALEAPGVETLKAMFDEAVTTQKATKVLVDCAKLVDIDSDGLAGLVLLVQQLTAGGEVQVHFAQVWGVVGALLEVLGLGALLPLFPTQEAALTAFGDPGEKPAKKRKKKP